MTQIAQGAHVYLFPEPGQVYRVQADDVATVQVLYGAPSAVITLTAQSQTFGPYDSPAKLKITANTAAAEYTLLRAHYAELTQAQIEGGAVGALASNNAGGVIEPDGDVPTLGGAVTLPAMQTGLDAGTAQEKAAFQASVSGAVKPPKAAGYVYAAPRTDCTITAAAAEPAGVGARPRVSGVANLLGAAFENIGWYSRPMVANRAIAVVGVEAFVVGTTLVSQKIVSSDAGFTWYYVLVDGVPAMSAAAQITPVTNLATAHINVTLPDALGHTVTIYASNVYGFECLKLGTGGVATPAGRNRPKLSIVADSFGAGSAGNENNPFKCMSWLLVQFGWDVHNNSFGGTGYQNAGVNTVFGSPARVANVAAFAPERIVFFGSVNDNSTDRLTLGAAATACWSAYKAASPAAMMTIYGVQPTGTDSTIVATKSPDTGRAIYAAAQAFVTENPGQAKYVELLGLSDLPTIPAAYAAGTYQPGDRITYNNAVWRMASNASYTFGVNEYPMSPVLVGGETRWALETKFLYGAGNISAGGTGSRAVLLSADNTHYTPAGNMSLAALVHAELI